MRIDPAPVGEQCGHAMPQGFASCTRRAGHLGDHQGGGWEWRDRVTRCPSAVDAKRQGAIQCALEFGHRGNHHGGGWEWKTAVVVEWARPDTTADVRRGDTPSEVLAS